ncbi:molybdenum cofactor guanylyltransferase MobA [Poseidonibacter lekithochrous]|uniref:molybdenum cofactor guanylyltransferase MobA n=1 Tax=Poseidonibacter lekithochrous TaxID=1904463 RepID=UPI0008FC49A6|nr:molybdenum cofactor guanylyltransferase MobA [Poseidonibacter lekithochrous]QKJ21560.1 molybdenum cofactor guanylyltransferase protein A [Poseidonibacter lekithochrous]
MPTTFNIPCVILCGGRSSRMGEDKSLLPFDHSNSLTQYQYDRLKPYFKELYISSKINKFDFLEDESSLILDEGEVFSPLVALDTIIKKFENQKIFIITVDTPLVSIDTINKIINSSNDYDITVAQTERIHNLCGVFSSSIRNSITKMLSDDIHKVGYLLKQNNTNVINLPENGEFINLNDKDEYNKALEIISLSNN